MAKIMKINKLHCHQSNPAMPPQKDVKNEG